jgi:hypothetical protein
MHQIQPCGLQTGGLPTLITTSNIGHQFEACSNNKMIAS